MLFRSIHEGDKCRIFWICETFNSKGKAHCPAQQIPEAILHETAARALGLSVFDEVVFKKCVSAIRAPENGVLIFIMKDGGEVRETWQNKSRRHSWTPEMRQKARADALRGQRMKGGAAQ